MVVRVSQMPVEMMDDGIGQWIASELESCQTIEQMRYFWYEVGLAKHHLQVGWNLLTTEVKQRLRLLFKQMMGSDSSGSGQAQSHGIP